MKVKDIVNNLVGSPTFFCIYILVDGEPELLDCVHKYGECSYMDYDVTEYQAHITIKGNIDRETYKFLRSHKIYDC